MVLLARQRDLHQLFHDAGVDAHAEAGDAGSRAEDLERLLLERRCELHRDRLGDCALAGESIPLTYEIVAELDLVHDRRRRDRAGDKLHAAGGAAAAAPARRGDVDAAGVRGLENAGAGRDAELAAHRGIARSQDDERDGHPRLL
jgi:hypothetical protein